MALAACLAGTALAQQARNDRPPVVTSSPPPGFEDITEPQATLIELVFLGRVIANVPVRYDPEFLTFDNPLDLLTRLEEVSEPAPVLRVLSGRLKTNANLACRRQKEDEEDCGRLTPDVAGIIFDRNRFRADLFVSPNLLHQGTSVDRFLPPPSGRDFAFLGLAGSLAGSRGQSAAYSVRQDARIGWETTRLVSETQKSEDGPITVEGLRAEHDEGWWRYTAGLFRNRPLSAISDLNIVGISINTQTDTLVDRGLADPNQLAVFLPRRSQVRVLRDGRLLFSQIYEAGNRAIDPRLMPDGAYEVVLQITEPGGGTREERRFFVKQEAVPTTDMPFYFFDLGRLVRLRSDSALPSVETVPVARAGTRRRINQNFAVGGDIIVSNDEGLAEFDLTHITRDWLARLSVFGSNHADYGLSATVTAAMGDFNYSASARHIWANRDPARIGILQDLSLDQTQLNASAFRTIGSASLGLRLSLNESEGRDRTYSIGPSFRYPLGFFGDWQADFLADASQSDSETVVFARLNFRLTTFRESLSVTGGYQHSELNDAADPHNRTGSVGQFDASRNWRGILDDDELTTTVGGGREPTRRNLFAAGDYRHARGRANGNVDLSDVSGSGIARTYSLNGTTNLIGGNLTTREPAFGVGGFDQGDAAVNVGIRGEAPDNEFLVYVDGALKARVKAGERRTIVVPSYKTYDVRIAATGNGNVHYESESRRLTVYPGNVASASWLVQAVVPVFGRAIGRDGEGLAFARIEGAVEPSFTDDLGYFQVEMPKDATLTFTPRSGAACSFPVKLAAEAGNEFVRLGTLRCAN